MYDEVQYSNLWYNIIMVVIRLISQFSTEVNIGCLFELQLQSIHYALMAQNAFVMTYES